MISVMKSLHLGVNSRVLYYIEGKLRGILLHYLSKVPPLKLTKGVDFDLFLLERNSHEDRITG